MMRDPAQILEKVKRRYWNVWRDTLLDEDPGLLSMPLDPPTASAIVARSGEVAAWLTAWRQWALQHPHATLRTRSVPTKFGDQPVYTHLDIYGTTALADLNPDTATHWERAKTRWHQLRPNQPGEAVKPFLAQIMVLYDSSV